MARSARIGVPVLIGLLMLARAAQARPARVDLDPPLRINPARVEMIPATHPFLVAWSFEHLFICSDRDGAQEIGIPWTAVPSQESFALARKLIDRKAPEQWTWLGMLMVVRDDQALARRAFKAAANLDPALRRKIDNAMAEVRRGRWPPDAFRPLYETPESGSPPPSEEARPPGRRGVSGPVQWPALTDEQRAEHTERVKAVCEQLMKKSGLALQLHETEHFLFYSRLSRGETRHWVGELDRMYQTLLRTLEIPEGTKLFQGKCAVFVFKDRDTFIRFELEAFNNEDAGWAGGFNHQRAGDTFTTFYMGSDEQQFNTVLIHETVHAFIYRYRSSARLPIWANEGLADFVAGHLVRFSNRPSAHWSHARSFVVQGGDPHSIMELSYVNRSWPTDDSYEVSHMLVRFMLKYEPRAFKLWIDDIKAGESWIDSLDARFNVSPTELAEGFARDIRAERGFARLK